ncbi:ArsR/SmtB family transcription factor [Microbacterium maritypicum]|uniref:ArsR/SmtB family transcription factor n=1 Tax=Microbacterium maritypicum TaxID=33918 RepID=UPI00380B652A
MLLGASPARVELLRLLLDRHELTALEIMDVLGMTRNGVGKHLDELTAAGFLIARRAIHPRGVGGVIYWRADRERHQSSLSGCRSPRCTRTRMEGGYEAP